MSTAVSNKIDRTLTNDDLAPTTRAHRTWGTYNYLALWFSMSMEITTYQLASSLINKGMDWKQAVGTVAIANLIVLIPMLLNAHAPGLSMAFPSRSLFARRLECAAQTFHPS